jgi:hypothetical protein
LGGESGYGNWVGGVPEYGTQIVMVCTYLLIVASNAWALMADVFEHLQKEQMATFCIAINFRLLTCCKL